MIIAVDGPAASGKGTIARALARYYRLPYMDTGLLYRAAALNLLRLGLDPESELHAARACGVSQIAFNDPDLRSELVAGMASRIASFALVRKALYERQVAFANQPRGAVLDGRDIGTVIAPQASAKLFVVAAPEVRAHRRHEELTQRGQVVHYGDILAEIRSRDKRDIERAVSPLTRADDAAVLDTTEMSVDVSIAEAIARVALKLGAQQ